MQARKPSLQLKLNQRRARRLIQWMLFRSPRGWILLRIFQQWNGTVICLKRNGHIVALSHNRRKASKNGMDIWAIDSDPRFDEFDLFFRGLRTKIGSMSGLLRRSQVFYLIFGKSKSVLLIPDFLSYSESIYWVHFPFGVWGWFKKKRKGFRRCSKEIFLVLVLKVFVPKRNFVFDWKLFRLHRKGYTNS